MRRPDAARLFASMEETWPPAATRRVGPALLRSGHGGGNRVSAATMEGACTPDQITAAETAMRAMGQTPLWMIPPWQMTFDKVLDTRGYRIHEPVWLYLAPIDRLAHEPPRVSAFATWPPLAISRDLWADGGIGPARLAVMDRACFPKTAVLGRANDRAAGVAFVAIADHIAWLHALHVPDWMRRNGVARNIMHRAAVWARAEGARWLGLAVTRQNTAGNGLYASLGMEIVEQYHYRIL